PRTKYWDTCAPQAIIEEAGGTITDLFGEPLRYDSSDVRNLNGIVASNGVIHQETLKKLEPLLTEFGRLRVIV
ncbi:MAG: inositol monophosphatase family protein, partial [Acidobacteriota bacterium]